MYTTTNKTLNIRGRILDLSTPKIMGILNITPDSFYDGSRYTSVEAALTRVEKMMADGADFVDVGGYSSRPGATDISEKEELDRVIPVVDRIHKRFPGCIISIDTFRSTVAREALQYGASVINDISGGDLDERMMDVVTTARVPYIVMHMRGTPQHMNQQTEYENVTRDVVAALQKKVHRLERALVADVMIDPGFGFAKTVNQNFEMLSNLHHFHLLGKPLLVGLSRKSMIWRTLQITAQEALNGTTALHTIALLKGASILRVHDVKEAKQCVQLVGALKK